MPQNTLTATDITVIASLVTVIAAVISPLITEIVSQIGNSRMKSNELFLESKISAYSDLLNVLSIVDIRSQDDLHKLLSALSRAKLFALPNSYVAITVYSPEWAEYLYAVKINLPCHSEKIRVDNSYEKLMLELNNEILKMRKK